MANIDLGLLPASGAAVVRNDETITSSDPIDVFEFRLGSTSNLNLMIKGISSGDDVDVTLFRDSNGNGVFDSKDAEITERIRSGNADESINLADQPAGTYFAFVVPFSPGSSGNVTYDLALSTSEVSNLLPREFSNISSDAVRTGSVNNSDPVDTYTFSVGASQSANISLAGLSANANIRVIQDSNSNQIVNAGEVIRSSTSTGTGTEFIFDIDPGNYFLQVYQVSGSSNYTVNFDYF